jgi:hypothetical protein
MIKSDLVALGSFSSELSSDDWRAFFAGYSNIVLVANSEEVDIDALTSRFPDATIFVFFNKAYKVLCAPFTRQSLLISRSGTEGSNLVKSRKVAKVTCCFDQRNFFGIVNLVIGDNEKFSPASAFGDLRVSHLDLTEVFAPFYPPSSHPTTGFALCFWLTTLGLEAKITLAGFSSKRGERYQVLDVHDWTFEQVVLRLLYRNDKIDFIGRERANPYASLSAHFPQYSPAEVELTASEVLSERLVNLSSVVDRLMHVTKFLRFVDRAYKKLRRKRTD